MVIGISLFLVLILFSFCIGCLRSKRGRLVVYFELFGNVGEKTVNVKSGKAAYCRIGVEDYYAGHN